MTIALGAGFRLPPVEVVAVEEPTVEDVRSEAVLVALAGLREALVEMPAPVVHVDAPDLSAIVTAVAGLKPGADAEDVARAVVRELAPTAAPEQPEILEKLAKALDRLDFRLKGLSTGGGSVVGSTVKNEVGTSLDTRRALTDTRYEYQMVGGNNVPLYVGTATPGSLPSAAVWRIEKSTYEGGLLTVVQSAVGAWTQRAALFGGAVVVDPTPTSGTYGTATYNTAVYG